MPSNFRYDPFLGTMVPVTISDELIKIPTVSPYRARLREVPSKDDPSSLSMRVRDTLAAAIISTTVTTITVSNVAWFANGDVITVDNEKMLVNAVSGNDLTVTRGYAGTVAATHTSGTAVYIENSMSEVAAEPIAGQFWPDYSTSDTDWNTGLLQFNSADAGKVVAVNYQGIGTPILASIAPAVTVAYEGGTTGTSATSYVTKLDTVINTPGYRYLKFNLSLVGSYTPGEVPVSYTGFIRVFINDVQVAEYSRDGATAASYTFTYDTRNTHHKGENYQYQVKYELKVNSSEGSATGGIISVAAHD